jgi:hypothetical protein
MEEIGVKHKLPPLLETPGSQLSVLGTVQTDVLVSKLAMILWVHHAVLEWI